MEQNKSERLYLPQFDVIRFFAAFVIIIYHAYAAWHGWFGVPGFMSTGDYKTLTPFGYHLEKLIKNMPLGVDVFFFISGYLLTYLLVMEKERFGKINIPHFYIRRGLRIWPLYFFLVALAFIFIRWNGANPPNYTTTLLMVNNFQTIHTQEWIYPFSHFWSICIEEHFYLVWPLIIAFVPNRKLIPTIFGLILLSWAYKSYTYMFMQGNWYELYLHTLSRMDVILMGGMLAAFYIRKPFVFKLNGWISAGLMLVMLVILTFDDVSDFLNMFTGVMRRPVYIALLALPMMDLLFNPARAKMFSKRIPLLYLGKVSYGIYMYGNIIVPIVIKKVMLVYGNNIYLFFGLTISLSLIVPVISYELLEKPFLKLKQRFALVKTRI
ncbi:MAG: acyltransferase [Bacteroidota bacterium]